MKILVIEDEAKLARVIRQGLAENGFSVDVAQDGAQGFMQACSPDYDAVILDILLPHKSGFDVLSELRRLTNRVPILILTARSSVEDRVRGLDLGADDYLPKPFDFRELLARLRAIVRRPHIEPLRVLHSADLELDPAGRTVRRQGRLIEVTAREFALLEYLLRNEGIVVTRAMILDRVWESDYDGGSNLVDVYINYLRRKIDHEFEPKLIHTIRGIGYVLREKE